MDKNRRQASAFLDGGTVGGGLRPDDGRTVVFNPDRPIHRTPEIAIKLAREYLAAFIY
jgi:hypothetical protein